MIIFFFFQAEDGIRDKLVTGVQTCALPIFGDEILVRPGDKIPLDGTVVGGYSDVNEAQLTGESLPMDKGPGDEVFAGSINRSEERRVGKECRYRWSRDP